MREMTERVNHSFFSEYPDVVSVEDLSHMLNLCKCKAYDLVRSGQVHGVKIGHVYRIPKKSIYQYLDAPSERG